MDAVICKLIFYYIDYQIVVTYYIYSTEPR